MGRGVIDLPMTEIAAFISRIESAFTWEKYLVVSRFPLCMNRYSLAPANMEQLNLKVLRR